MANRKWYGWTGRMLRATGLLIGLGLVALGGGLGGIRPQPAAAAGDIQIDAGWNHTCALVNGGVKCWGNNELGQLGDGTIISRSTPVDVSGLTSGVTAISAGYYHTCALVNGGVKCWGDNSSGKLGDGTIISRSTPVDVSGLTSGGVTAISAGTYNTCALVNGGVKCWGDNDDGQLGNGMSTDSNIPVVVKDSAGSGTLGGVTAIATGDYYNCAVVSGGMKCWGYNNCGQLGNGTITDKSTPVDVSGLGSGVTAIAAGGYHTCAVVSGGLKCWGDNFKGQLGDGTGNNKYTPVDVSGLGSGVTSIAAGWLHTCALVNGGMKCWGFNSEGLLGEGDGIGNDKLTPVDVSGLGSSSGVTAITTGEYHTCALVNGGMKCWGNNRDGQLGDGTSGINTEKSTPVDVVAKLNLKQGATTLANGGSYAFGSVNVGSTKVVSFTVENPFPGLLKLTGSPKVAVTGPEFGVTQDATSPVGAGGSTTFQVTFTPSAGGTRSATVTIVSNDPTYPNYTLTLNGTGVGPTNTPTHTPTVTNTPTNTSPPTNTATASNTATPNAVELTATAGGATLTPTNTALPTAIPTSSSSRTITPTSSSSQTITPTQGVYGGLTVTSVTIKSTPNAVELTATAGGATLTPSRTPTAGVYELTTTPTMTSTTANKTTTPTMTSTATKTVTPTPTPIVDDCTGATSLSVVPGTSDTVTIFSQGSGDWNKPATWNLNRIPTVNDVVGIRTGHGITLTNGVQVKGFCNRGLLTNASSGTLLKVEATQAFRNFGQILSKDGQTVGQNGSSIELRGKPFYNEGTIQAGAGSAGSSSGGDGGSTFILAENTTNTAAGIICAGKGGAASTGYGGNGGDAHVWGKFISGWGGGYLINYGKTCAGDGGIGKSRGGNGGNLKLISLPYVYLYGKQYAGKGYSGGWNGGDGDIIIEPDGIIDLSGKGTEISGGDITIFGGNKWNLNLSNMASGAIKATGSVTLAVGLGGSIDLSGSAPSFLSAAGKVVIASDVISKDAGVDLSSLVGTKVITKPAQLLGDVSLGGPGRLLAEAGQTLSATLTLLNGGPQKETYDLSWSAVAGSKLTGLPSTATVDPLSGSDLIIQIVPTSVLSDVITLTAKAQSNPLTSATTKIELVPAPSLTNLSTTVYLPLIVR